MNTEDLTIKRRTGAPEFDILRTEMIQQVQELGGHQWTDYNLHDPGVTIVEQLCYALTDINYRSQYSAEQILINQYDQLDLHHQGLYTKHEALPTRPVNALDLQKYLLDRIPDLAYVGVVPVDGFSGLLDIALKPYSESCDRQSLIKEVRECYLDVRNLCENLRNVSVIPEATCQLVATITIAESISATDVLSKTYAIAQRYLLGEVERSDYEDVKEGDPLASYLDGPLLNNHYIADSSISSSHKLRPTRMLISKLKAIAGVIDIDDFRVEASSQQTPEAQMAYTQLLPAISSVNLRLVIPQLRHQIKVDIIQNGQRIGINIDEFTNGYQSYVAHGEHQRHVISLIKEPTIKSLPHVDIKGYTTVQHQFPANYGINAYGVPAHSTTQRKAQAKQLKAYLLLFDQLMSDHLLTLDRVKNLFSINIEDSPSYPTQTVSSVGEQSLKALCQQAQLPTTYLADLNGYDSPVEHKHRVLDYIYALNGRNKERFGLELNNPYYTNNECRKVLLKSKQTALKRVHTFAANRFGASNVERPSWNTENSAFLERRLCLLLGIEEERRSLIAALQDVGLQKKDNSGFHFFESQEGQEGQEDVASNLRFFPMKEVDLHKAMPRLRAVPPVAESHENAGAALKTLLANPDWHNKQGKHCVWLFGTELGNYRIGKIKSSEYVDVILKVSSERAKLSRWIYLGSFTEEVDAIHFVNQIRYQTSELNKAMEGLHLLEHVQLLPASNEGQASTDDLINPEFYQNQISVFLPNWTTRFIDAEFRLYVEDLIRNECPAHIYANVFWVGFGQMQSFEWLYQNWCKHKCEGSGTQKLNRISAQLSKLLIAAQSARNPQSPKTPELTHE